jgi:hypothetical protein
MHYTPGERTLKYSVIKINKKLLKDITSPQ